MTVVEKTQSVIQYNSPTILSVSRVHIGQTFSNQMTLYKYTTYNSANCKIYFQNFTKMLYCKINKHSILVYSLIIFLSINIPHFNKKKIIPLVMKSTKILLLVSFKTEFLPNHY